jgi:hypothetical protein
MLSAEFCPMNDVLELQLMRLSVAEKLDLINLPKHGGEWKNIVAIRRPPRLARR